MLKKLKAFLTGNNGFMSEPGKFLKEFDKTRSKKSDSQMREIKKHDRVFHLRDHAMREENKNKLWEEF